MLSSILYLFVSLAFSKDINIMVIDTGVDLSHEYIKSHAIKTNVLLDYTITNDHGTHVAGLVLKDTCKEVKLYSCNYYHRSALKSVSDFSNDCFRRALELKIDYINYSSGGKEFLKEEKELIQKLLKRGTKIIVSAGNDGENNPNYYPAKYQLSGLTVVGNLDKYGFKHFTSNYGYKNMVWELGTEVESTLPNGKFGKMTGTSQSTAIKTNKLLKNACENNIR